jgi:valyl-tRNA synthetase
MMNLEKVDLPETIDDKLLTQADRWILSKSNTLVKEATDNLETFELGIAAQKVYDFIWEEFCDWYIEMVKPRLYNDEDDTKVAALWTLQKVLTNSLKLLHPYMPFVTEEIFCTLQEMTGLKEKDSIMISLWPKYNPDLEFTKDVESIEIIKGAVKGIRNLRSEMNVPPSRKATVFVVSDSERIRNIFTESKVFFASLGFASEVLVQKDKSGISEDAVSTVIPGAQIYIPFADLVDIEKEIERLTKEKARLEGELKRVKGMLSNPNFVSKAPESKIAEEKAKLQKYTDMMDQVMERLKSLDK